MTKAPENMTDQEQLAWSGLRGMMLGAFALTFTLGHAWSKQDIYDKCESQLRLCFQKCMDRKSEPKVCNMDCNTALCEAIGGQEKPLTEFLNWKNTKGKVWL